MAMLKILKNCPQAARPETMYTFTGGFHSGKMKSSKKSFP
jgi:hypothetical protein